jgi:hypothetical protein
MKRDFSAGEEKSDGAACTSTPRRPSDRAMARKARRSSPSSSTRSGIFLASPRVLGAAMRVRQFKYP